MRSVFPFSAIVGQEEMKQALLIAAVDQAVGGVLVFGDIPDSLTVLGMVIVAVGGILVALPDRRHGG